MEGVLALLMPVLIVFIVSHYRFRSKELALREKQTADPKLLAAAAEEKKQLEARLQNLEAIVCSVDFELNQRLNRLAASQSLALPPKGQTPPMGLAAVSGAPAPAPAPSIATGPTLGPASLPAYAMGVLAPGQMVLSRYTIVRELGRGGMGAVYLADDAKLNERVALKTISAGMCGDYDYLADRFRREVQAARRVTHENVIRIHDLGEDGHLLFLSMEYVEGETLWMRLRRVGGLPIIEARAVLDRVAAGVAAAHGAGVVHRDLKPHNVLLGPRDLVKVIDFGLAKATFMVGLTATGAILGTPDYMAPEQIRGGEADVRSDVYALGATAYAALAGRPPFEGSTPIAVGFRAVNEAPRPLRELRTDVPPALETAVMRALSKDPLARFRDAAEWRKALGG